MSRQGQNIGRTKCKIIMFPCPVRDNISVEEMQNDRVSMSRQGQNIGGTKCTTYDPVPSGTVRFVPAGRYTLLDIRVLPIFGPYGTR